MLAAATVLFAALTAAAGAGANVYKCQGGAGSGVVYQDEPCPPGRELRNFDADPPDLSVINGGFARAPAAAEKPRPAPLSSARRRPARPAAAPRNASSSTPG